MAKIRFPSSKSLNQVIITNNVSYKWDGRKWRKLAIEAIDAGAVQGLETTVATSVASSVDSAIANSSTVTTAARSAISVSGNLNYNSSTGVISYTQRTDGQIRALFSASGDLSYNSSTGAFSFTEKSNSTIRGLFSGGGNISYNSSTGAISYTNTRYLQIIAVEKSTDLANGTDIIGAVEIPKAGTITSLRAKTTSGTATVAFKINGSSIGSVNATTSGANSSVSSSVSAFDDLTLDVSSASGAGLVVTLTITDS